MSIKTLDGKLFAKMVIQGANCLSSNAKFVDSLNVFPVPDGDTGTNMNLSMKSGAKEVKANIQDHVGKVGAALAKGLLMGARGNSGVILSQLFRGFSKYMEQKSSLNGKEFALAFDAGVKTAYKAVMKPVEGTILTVAKDAAKKGLEAAEKSDDLVVIMEEILREAKASLKRTPDLLPVLKEVGVVDSGGQGLVFIYEGFLSGLKGEELPEGEIPVESMDELVNAEHHIIAQSHMNTEDIVYGYCTEFMVKFEEGKKPFSEEIFRQDLSEYGDSLLVVADETMAKVHIHSEQPGAVLTYGQQYGSLINMKIENMREQHSAIVGSNDKSHVHTPAAEKLEYGIITVSMGSGISDLFKSIGAHKVIEGGQTMNPSTEDFVKAMNEINSDKIIILPNNKNIIMAAEQAAEVSDKEVAVVPSRTIPQGMAALLAFNPQADLDRNKEDMSEALGNVKTGQITHAVRDTTIDGLTINKDDYMGLLNGKIVIKDRDKLAACKQLAEKMIDEDSEIFTIIKGEDASDEDVEILSEFMESHFEDIEVEVLDGNQPLYPFIFSVE